MASPTDMILDWDEVVRFVTVAGIVWAAAWFLFRQQVSIKDLIYKKFDELHRTFLDKLEYHERHDDVRFDNIHKDLLNIQITQAKYFKNGNGK